MKISIVTPNYNYGHFIKKAIDSVFGQIQDAASPLCVEHIVIDGGSTDDTIPILENWEKEVSGMPSNVKDRYSFIWVSEKDKGQTDAINKGLKKAAGDIVCWLNADEYYLPGSLKIIMDTFKKYPNVDFVYGEPVYVDKSGSMLRIKRDHPFSYSVLLWYGCYITSCCSFWRHRILDDGFFLDDSYKVTMDYEYWVRIANKGYKFKFVPAAIGAFLWHDGNVSRVYNDVRIEEEFKVKRLYGKQFFTDVRLQKKATSRLSSLGRLYRGFLICIRLLFMPT